MKHVGCIGSSEISAKPEGKTTHRRLACMLEDNIKPLLNSLDWNFFTSWATSSISRNTLLHGVSKWHVWVTKITAWSPNSLTCFLLISTIFSIRKYFCVPLWFMIDLFILPSVHTTNNLVTDYLLLMYSLRSVSDFIDPSSGRFGPYISKSNYKNV
jgi:hypothetical protein